LDEGLTRNASKESLSFDHGLQDDECSDWMSEVEMITHEGPSRHLWMGPQFSFKTFVNSSTCSPAAPVLTPSSGALLSQGISEQRLIAPGDTFSDELELQSLKLVTGKFNFIKCSALNFVSIYYSTYVFLYWFQDRRWP
jgi:hypothetical protein